MMHLDLIKETSGLMLVPDDGLGYSIGTAPKNCNSVNYNLSPERIRYYERYLLYYQTGIPQDKIFFLNQLHGDRIVRVDGPDGENRMYHADADAMITDKPGLCLVIRTADCVPLFLADMTKPVAAAVHSGWKSTALDIAGKTVRKMAEEYGSKPSDLRAYVLPGIGIDSYEVGKEVAEMFPDHNQVVEGKYFVGLGQAIVSSLMSEGLSKKNIYSSFYDTFRENDLFFSHRKGDAGRNLNFIYIK